MINFENLGYKDITKDKPIQFIECLAGGFDNVNPYSKRFYKQEGNITIEVKVGNCHNMYFISGICYYPKGWEKFDVCAPKDYIGKMFTQTINAIKLKIKPMTMKELTTEEKAQRYDEAIKIARKLNDGEGVPAPPNLTAYEVMFPELKESENEKIKKEIVELVMQPTWKTEKEYDRRKELCVWIEKQGENNKKGYSVLVGGVEINDYNLSKEEAEKRAEEYKKDGYDDVIVEKKGNQKPNPYSGTWFEYNGHTWGMCARDNGVEILIDGNIKGIVLANDNLAKELFIKALERVEEQNKKGYKLTDCDKNSWWEDFKAYSCIPLPQKQKLSDNIKSKFKVGDWIVNNEHNDIVQVLEVLEVNEKCRLDYGYTIQTISIEQINNDYHFWTIQDAKDGDVLATLAYIFIFKKSLENDGGISYCHYDFGAGTPQFIGSENNNWYFGKNTVIHPATKEQRELLFQKMKEAGYVWDEEKKELKKIEQKSTWSEEDEKIIDSIIDYMKPMPIFFESTEGESGKEYTSKFIDKATNWLEALKERIQPHNT